MRWLKKRKQKRAAPLTENLKKIAPPEVFSHPPPMELGPQAEQVYQETMARLATPIAPLQIPHWLQEAAGQLPSLSPLDESFTMPMNRKSLGITALEIEVLKQQAMVGFGGSSLCFGMCQPHRDLSIANTVTPRPRKRVDSVVVSKPKLLPGGMNNPETLADK
jgi:hypothetical protein